MSVVGAGVVADMVVVAAVVVVVFVVVDGSGLQLFAVVANVVAVVAVETAVAVAVWRLDLAPSGSFGPPPRGNSISRLSPSDPWRGVVVEPRLVERL